MDPALGLRAASPRAPGEPLLSPGPLEGLTIGDFWSWSTSDLLVNTNRGLLAEFLVARAIGDDTRIRDPWRPYDVETSDGITVEVKSASYIQSWAQKQFTYISFRVAPSRAWDPTTGEWEEERKRQADVYVFALLAHQDQTTIDPADVSQWRFHVLATTALNQAVADAESISLSRLRKLGAIEVGVDGLVDAVRDQASTIREAGEGGEGEA